MYDTSIVIYKSQEYHGLYSIIQSYSRHVNNQQIREEANIKTINRETGNTGHIIRLKTQHNMY